MALSLPCGGRDRVKNKFAQVTCGHGRSKLQTGAKPVAQCLCSVTRPGHLPDAYSLIRTQAQPIWG